MRPFDRATLPLLREARYELIGAVSATVVGGVLSVVQAFVLSGLVVSLVDRHTVGSWGWLVLFVFASRAAAGWVSDVLAAWAAAKLGVSLRSRVLHQSVVSGAADARPPGSLIALATRGVAAIEPYLTRFLPSLVVAATLPPLIVVAISTQDWISSLIVILTIPLIPVFAALVGWATQAKAERQWRDMATLAGHFHDVVRGLPTLVAFRRAEAQTDNIRKITHRHRRATLDTLRLAFASSAVLELVATISVALVAVSVGLRLAAGDLDLQTALVVLLLAPEAYWPLRRVGAEFHAAAEGGATLREIAALGDTRCERSPAGVPDVRNAIVTMVDVSVTYPGRTAPALSSVSGEIQPGGLVAVTGASGAGKSTLLAALRRRIEWHGRIEVGGVDLRELDVESWQRQIAWVPQRPWFVDGSIGDNVRLARNDATDGEVWDALRRVGLADVAVALPGGLDAQVGEDAKFLSAGERARLSLARAVVARRPLVLLDEPTAHLDATTERVVLETLRWLSTVSTVVVVAHRRAVVDLADRVIAVNPSSQSHPASADGASTQSAPVGSSRNGPDVGDVDRIRAPDPPDRREPNSGALASAAGSSRRTAMRLWLAIVLGSLAASSGVALTATAGWLIVRASQQPPVLMLLVAIIAVRTFGIARPVLRYGERLMSHDAALRALADERVAVYTTLIPLTPGALGRRRGDLLASIVDDVDAHVDRRLRVWSPVATAIGVGIIASVVSALILPIAGLVAAATVLFGLGSFLLAQTMAARAERAFVSDRALLSRQVGAFVEGREHLAAWGTVSEAAEAIDVIGRRSGRAGIRSAMGAATARGLVLLSVGAAVWATASGAATSLEDDGVSAPLAALLVLVPLGLGEVLASLPDAGMASARVRRAIGRLTGLRHIPPRVTEAPDAVSLADLIVADRAEVALSGVAAGWGAQPVFTGVDLRLAPGERLAVVGPSGSGKSTLASLLLRFLDPMTGSVSLGGVDLRRLRLSDVRATVGLVDDDPHVFGSTLAENIRLARPSASDDDLALVLEAAQLGDWMRTLPDGLDTFLGDVGADVSGGERARIALARSLLADEAVLVLDEPVSHLDSATAGVVLDDLLSASSGRTMVLITHGASEIEGVDRVLDLSAGDRIRQVRAAR